MRITPAALVAAFLFSAATATAQQYCLDTSGRCYPLGQIFGTTCNGMIVAVCPTPTPTPGQLVPHPVAVMFPDPGHPTCWYGGSVIFEDGKYTAWVTVNDAILRYTSTNGAVWVGGQRVLEATEPWENDDQGIDTWEGYQHGVSNACVLRLPCGYVMGYTAGPTVNVSGPLDLNLFHIWANGTGARGGIGVAYSQDGISWTKDNRNPIYLTPSGGTQALSAVTINGLAYLYFSSSGNGAGLQAGIFRWPLDSAGHPFPIWPELLRYTDPAYPVAWDLTGCWMVRQEAWGGAGPTALSLYQGSDCYSALGTRMAGVDKTFSGHAANMLPFLVNRGPDGRFLGTVPTYLYSAGDAWATWQLQAVTVQADPVKTVHLHITVAR